MIEVVCALCAGWAVLRLFGVDRRWPGRIAELSSFYPGVPVTGGRRAQRGHVRLRRGVGRPTTGGEVQRDLLLTVDLVRLAVTAGHTLHSAVAAVGEVGQGPVASAFGRVARANEHGASLVEALERLPDELGVELRPFVTSLSVAAASGASLAPVLTRLSDAERRRQRRRAEERVRRLPVLLLAPLVGLVMPAFFLLTIAPVAITTARSAAVLASPGPSSLPPLTQHATIPDRSPP